MVPLTGGKVVRRSGGIHGGAHRLAPSDGGPEACQHKAINSLSHTSSLQTVVVWTQPGLRRPEAVHPANWPGLRCCEDTSIGASPSGLVHRHSSQVFGREWAPQWGQGAWGAGCGAREQQLAGSSPGSRHGARLSGPVGPEDGVRSVACRRHRSSTGARRWSVGRVFLSPHCLHASPQASGSGSAPWRGLHVCVGSVSVGARARVSEPDL